MFRTLHKDHVHAVWIVHRPLCDFFSDRRAVWKTVIRGPGLSGRRAVWQTVTRPIIAAMSLNRTYCATLLVPLCRLLASITFDSRNVQGLDPIHTHRQPHRHRKTATIVFTISRDRPQPQNPSGIPPRLPNINMSTSPPAPPLSSSAISFPRWVGLLLCFIISSTVWATLYIDPWQSFRFTAPVRQVLQTVSGKGKIQEWADGREARGGTECVIWMVLCLDAR